MKTSHIYTILASLALATGSAIPRSKAESCCFSLYDASTGEIVRQETVNGILQLGGNSPEASFCLDLSDDAGVLRDEDKDACFVAPANEIKCHDYLPGPQTWALGAVKDGSRAVTYDGEENFKACSEGDGESLWSADKGGCRSLKIEAKELRGAC